ncbi:GumC family protein [Pedobacter sp. AW31-3R]|uniref:GumC family protein n=1 Tax=Pedobacter sp. AW31-3R TaxID=3445781 RepID=UPI003F9F51D3
MSNKKFDQVMDEFDNDRGFENLLSKFVSNWYWFVISCFLGFLLTWYIAKIQTPMHLIDAKVLINDPKLGASAGDGALGSLTGMTGSVVENEAEVLRTRFLMESVVKEMKLNITYFSKERFRDEELYASPFIVDVVEYADTIASTTMDVEFLSSGKIRLTNDLMDTVVSYSKPLKVKGLGLMQILKTSTAPKSGDYIFTVTSVDKAVEKLTTAMIVLVPNKAASVIDITFNYPLPGKGVDIMNTLLNNYVRKGLENRNKVADTTYAFIQNRLKYLGGELGSLEGNIQTFRQDNKLTEMSQQATQLISNNAQFVNDLSQVETQISVLTSLQEYLQEDKGRVVPSSLVVSDPTFSELVQKYNTMLLERDRRMMGVTEENPMIINLDKRIANLRSDMMASLSSSKNSLGITRASLQRRIKTVEGRAQGVPATERNYLDLARQQKIKEDLFIFLMQKGEETAISKTNNISNSTNIDPPKAETSPFSPKKGVYYFVGIFLGLVIPAALIYLRFLLNTKIDSKADVTDRTNVPIMGEISRNTDQSKLIITDTARDVMSEQFRALRTNLRFFLKNPAEKVILFTSSMSGEGKSFGSINLASILALSGKKVLLMEMDLRKPGVSSKLNIRGNVGFTSYIIDTSLKVEDIVKPLPALNNLFFMSSGALPPNPAEMIISPRAEQLFAEVRTQYDYVIMDAPPIGIVTDAQLIGDYADLCIYVVRQNYTLKSQISIVQDLKRHKSMKNIGILVNDITSQQGSGYGYGYNYGDYSHTVTPTIWQKLFSRFKRP